MFRDGAWVHESSAGHFTTRINAVYRDYLNFRLPARLWLNLCVHPPNAELLLTVSAIGSEGSL
jgi:hypothetical protein